MSNQDFQWIFPSAPSNVTSAQNFTAQNASDSAVFGKHPLYANDAIRLEWNSPSSSDQTASIQFECGISSNGSRSPIGLGQSFTIRPPYIWTLEFLSFPSLSPKPLPLENPSSLPTSGPAEDICVFSHENTTFGTFYLTTAFTILNTTRQGQSYLYTVDNPSGSPYTVPSAQPATHKKSNKNLAAIFGSVFGCLALLGVVVTLVCLCRRREARRKRFGKDLMGESTSMELERMGSVVRSLPPAYKEREHEDAVPEKVGAIDAKEPAR